MFKPGDKVIVPGGTTGTVIEDTEGSTLVEIEVHDPSYYAVATVKTHYLPGEIRLAPEQSK
jgi:hypothetical protein